MTEVELIREWRVFIEEHFDHDLDELFEALTHNDHLVVPSRYPKDDELKMLGRYFDLMLSGKLQLPDESPLTKRGSAR